MSNGVKKPRREISSSTKFTFWMVALVVVVLTGFVLLSNHSPKHVTTAKSSKVTIDYKGQPYLGKQDAPVSIVEFGDYKCPNCKNFSDLVVPVLKKSFMDTGKAKFYFFNDAFIFTDSTRSAKFAESVYAELGNDAFWKFHDELYKEQPKDPKAEKQDVYTEKFLTDALTKVASADDVQKVVKNFEDKKSEAALEKDMSYVKKLNVQGTPTLFINGKQFTGKKLSDLTTMIENAAKGE